MKVIRIGRSKENDVVIPHETVSSRHARLTIDNGRLWLEDLGSTNGTFVGSTANRITKMEVQHSDVIYLGSAAMLVSDLTGDVDGGQAAREDVKPRRTSSMGLEGDNIVVGRDPGCDVPVSDPTVSRRHARIRRQAGRIFVSDLGSSNGTFVNGRRISGEVEVRPGDTIALGSYTFRITDKAVEQEDFRGDVTIEVRDVAVDAGPKRLIDGISFTIRPGEVVGLMGPSGSGKTTLMSAINGYQQPTTGFVLFNGLDLYTNYDQFRLQMCYVPQDDIMHAELTVYQALKYTARLRLPSDSTEADIDARIKDVVTRLGLAGTENVLIGSPDQKGISGGQRKRVNIAMELLTDPSVLFLDEPTSGLSSQDALKVMKVIRELANSGKTILLTIHQPSSKVFRMMDHLIVLAKDQGGASPGRLAYFGPAFPESIQYFTPGAEGEDLVPEAVLEGLDNASAEKWVKQYKASPHHQKFVIERAGRGSPAGHGRKSFTRGQWLRQTITLTWRMFRLKTANKRGFLTFFVQPLVVAAVLLLVFSDTLRQEVSSYARGFADYGRRVGMVQFFMVVAALWFGCNNAARELVAERAIYRRERMVNLRIDSYLSSKFAVFGAVCALQCALLLWIVAEGCRLRAPGAESFVLLWAACVAGLGVGLTISSAARTSEDAIGLVPLVLIPMIILGGLMISLKDLPNDFTRALAGLMPSRWAFEGMYVLEAGQRERFQGNDMAFLHFPPADRTEYGVILLILAVMLATAAAITAWSLKRRDTRK
jgi:ABC-type multidrug transport system ATPase subunit/pSer/pThr/pTyr-binding forkhead associated (FHA) protein/ABC-type multidrug transport system permease subunit